MEDLETREEKKKLLEWSTNFQENLSINVKRLPFYLMAYPICNSCSARGSIFYPSLTKKKKKLACPECFRKRQRIKLKMIK